MDETAPSVVVSERSDVDQTSIWTVLDVYPPERALLIETLSDLGGSQ